MSSLRKGVGSLRKKLSTYEINEKNIKDSIRDFKRLLISNDVSIEVADQISKNLTKHMMGKRAQRFSDLSKLLLETANPILLDIISPKQNVNLIEEITSRRKRKDESASKNPIVILLLGINGTRLE